MWLTFKKHFALWAAVGLFVAIVAAQWATSVRANGGSFGYALDDAYIHMAIARQMSQRGVWGVTGDGFTSATSSPGWTLLLSLSYFIFGVNDIAPFILNILSALAIIVLVYHHFRSAPMRYRLLVLLALVFVTPLVWLVFTGMEHVLHTLVVLALVFAVQLNHRDTENTESGENNKTTALIMFLAAGATFLRYESVFLILALCGVLIWRGRWKLALLMSVAAALPIVVYGAISLAQGWYFVPNSLLVKSEGALYVEGDPFNYWLFSVFVTIARQPHLLVMFASAALLLTTPKAPRALLSVFIIALLLHARFAGVGVNYRYEAYLVALGIVVIAESLMRIQRLTAKTPREDEREIHNKENVVGQEREEYKSGDFQGYIDAGEHIGSPLRIHKAHHSQKYLLVRGWKEGKARLAPTVPIAVRNLGLVLLIVYAVLPLLKRAVETLYSVVPATENIYQQQYQMGQFLRQYYPGTTVALNDIGVVSYVADVHLIDLIGLANMDIARARQTGTYTPQRIGEIAANANFAIVYNTWFTQGIPEGWRAVGSWRLTMNNIVLGDSTVTFYAINPSIENRLTADLLDYSARLPAGVVESGEYTQLRDLHDTLGMLPSDSAFWTNAALREIFSKSLPPNSTNFEQQAPDVLVIDQTYSSERPSLLEHTLYRTMQFDFRGTGQSLDIFLRRPPALTDIATFGENISLRAWTLRGDDEDDTSVLPCERVIIESWWQNARPITLDYSITLSLFGDAAGIVFQDRAPPIAMTSWQPGSLYADVRALDIPCTMPRGDYPLALGIHGVDGQFLPVGAESFFVLTTLSVR